MEILTMNRPHSYKAYDSNSQAEPTIGSFDSDMKDGFQVPRP